ncbi:hypothetical protein GNI_060810 [Gregarina niphandrodes]|uniref:Transmembrane protein n=1 Tax=Gregarina niphandrodes TaxID=110365 RepID=A0A023B8E3_GRENI|nr:hypothetical protein GNI_060810 [Gregarina niphandrodes]EZG68901.1 hypothetical protein GNI_060810 [Gregarina niphandrodes]|eukprot:XP_011134525.1 hypothetical protein GNI_060810 [Gregarina niphandrodes]
MKLLLIKFLLTLSAVALRLRQDIQQLLAGPFELTIDNGGKTVFANYPGELSFATDLFEYSADGASAN